MLFTKHKKPRWLKRAVAGVTAVMLGAGVIVGGAAPALAADLYQPAGTVPGLDVGPRDATGALDLRAGGVQLAAVNQARTEYCVNLNALTSGADVVSVTDLPAPVPRVPGLEATSAQMAWIISHFKGGTDWDVAAIALLVHANYEAEPGPGTGYYGAGTKPGSPAEAAGIVINAVRSWAPGLETRAREMIAQAKASGIAGYTGGIPTGENHRHGTYTAPAIKNGAGQVLTSIPTKLMLVGPATWDENGTKTITATPGSVHKWSATANGTVNVTGSFRDPSGSLSKVLRQSTQDTVRWDSKKNETTVKSEAFEVVYDFQPRGVSNAVKLVDGGAFTDTLTAAADPAYGSGDWLTKEQVGSGAAGFVPVTYVARAYQVGTLELPATGDTVPKNARLVDTKTVTAAGPGDIEASFDVTEPGWYTVVWSVSKTGQGSNATYIHGDWADKYGMPEETVSKRYEAKIDSALSIRETKSGPYLVDDVFVTGLPKDHPNFKGGMRFSADAQEITHRVMFFPAGVEAADENLGQAVQVGDTVTIPAKNGFYPSVSQALEDFESNNAARLVAQLQSGSIFVETLTAIDGGYACHTEPRDTEGRVSC